MKAQQFSILKSIDSDIHISIEMFCITFIFYYYNYVQCNCNVIIEAAALVQRNDLIAVMLRSALFRVVSHPEPAKHTSAPIVFQLARDRSIPSVHVSL